MSELATLARPYASAVFKRAKETGKTDKWSQALAFMGTVLRDPAVSRIVDNPKISDERKSGLMLDLCREQGDQEIANFLKLLVYNKRLSLLPHIVRLYEGYKAEDEGYLEVDVLTAYALTKEAKTRLAESLEKTLSKQVHIKAAVDKSLIGGVLVRAGDKVIDGSIRGQLIHMQKTLQ
ncbi:MAG: F0F1 ATP synthase subunit delta [Gammaproteobacteria bacterium]